MELEKLIIAGLLLLNLEVVYIKAKIVVYLYHLYYTFKCSKIQANSLIIQTLAKQLR